MTWQDHARRTDTWLGLILLLLAGIIGAAIGYVVGLAA